MSGAASLFSAIGSARRKVADAMANPGLAFEQFIDHRDAEAGKQLTLLRDSGSPGSKTTPEQEKARNKLTEAMLENMNPAGILAGPMAKTANFDKLRKAVQMELKKAHPEEIWQNTGWTRGLDRRWRFEIPDQAAGPKGLASAGQQGQLATKPEMWLETFDKSYDHPELFAAYPQLKDIRGKLGVDPTMSARFAGQYMPGPGGGAGQMLALGKDHNYLNETVLHELQHGVQGLEKFAGGGNPQQFRGMVSSDTEAHKLYERLKGEAEARLVQGRSVLTPEELKRTWPFNPGNFRDMTGVLPEETFTSMPNPFAKRP